MTELRKELNGDIAYYRHEIRDIDREIFMLEKERDNMRREIVKKKNALRFLTCDDETVLNDYAEYVGIKIEIDDPELMAELREHMAKKERHVAHREIKRKMYAERTARKAQKKGV